MLLGMREAVARYSDAELPSCFMTRNRFELLRQTCSWLCMLLKLGRGWLLGRFMKNFSLSKACAIHYHSSRRPARVACRYLPPLYEHYN
jgi:hypothetical protein